MTDCTATLTTSFGDVVHTCQREPDDWPGGAHRGDHYAADPHVTGRGWRWENPRGYQSVNSHTAEPCATCGCPSDLRDGQTDCFTCCFWVQLADDIARPETLTLRPHDDEGPFHGKPYVYSWSPGSTGGFGDRGFAVTMDDGRTYEGRGQLWGRGDVPAWMVDRFPPNCRIEALP